MLKCVSVVFDISKNIMGIIFIITVNNEKTHEKTKTNNGINKYVFYSKILI